MYSLIPFFTDNLYFEISKNAIKTADTLKQALKEKGYTFYIDSPTNQIFLVLEDERLKELEQKWQSAFGKRQMITTRSFVLLQAGLRRRKRSKH